MASLLKAPSPLHNASPLSLPRTTISTTFQPLLPPRSKLRPWPLALKSSKTESFLTYLHEQFEDLQEVFVGKVKEEEPEKHQGPLLERWREIQGENKWKGLLEPMDPLLRREIIRYGEFAQACYDSFNFSTYSRYCGTCNYPMSSFFRALGMDDLGYEVSRYLYATSASNLRKFFRKSLHAQVWSQHANWIGYVSVATDPKVVKELGRRDILFAWRGTVTYLEWVEDVMDYQVKPNFGPDANVKVESGFLDLYNSKETACGFCSYSAREQVISETRRLMERYKDEGNELSITITGHSLGGALALLSAYDIAETGLNVLPDGRRVPITVFTFGSPRVGNRRFADRCDELGIHVLRVFNKHDKVPTVPGMIINEDVAVPDIVADIMPWSYSHVGVELELDHNVSPVVEAGLAIPARHNLELYLHLVNAYNGPKGGFKPAYKRDPALLNKSDTILKEKFHMPPCWRQDENKGLVRAQDGRWVVPERTSIDAHPPDTDHHLEQALKIAPGSSATTSASS
ncbi:phospholipase A1-Igamma3, chloroplastic [Amborella trichopoda]|uniref:Fungal lipase-type domain-containing protein n=1 Tax=Amborella trichopoda TaxID=13333 RepID=U5CWP0_AMBTC|nr:phospholipase A1-Igamma3, chloroplastic [Amborella trichopoda]ERN14554.1 hypothetical protein AMTR_s00038p00110060 [Amborella trichopoda]|eukprot:XP_006853087.1 phospholipase A1-Igamma3, chloroplastic [Amborella trichopoda]